MKHSNTPLEVQIPFLKGGSPAYNYYIFDSPAPHTYNVHNNQLLRMECVFLQKKKSKQTLMHAFLLWRIIFVNSHKNMQTSLRYWKNVGSI